MSSYNTWKKPDKFNSVGSRETGDTGLHIYQESAAALGDKELVASNGRKRKDPLVKRNILHNVLKYPKEPKEEVKTGVGN